MKKTLWALAGAIVLLVLVLGVKTCSDRAMHRERYAFDTTQVDQVVRLEIAYGNETAVLVRKDGAWLTSGDDFPVNKKRMESMLNTLLRIRETETVSESPDSARLVEFGLGEGEAKRVRWKLESGEEHTVLLGKTSGTDYNSTYWKREDSPEVYRTPGNFTHHASVREADWKTREVFPFFLYENVVSVAVDWIDSAGNTVHYRIDRTGDTSARLVEPLDTAIERRVAGEIYAQTPQFNIDALLDPWEDRSLAGLDTPKVKIEIVLRDKTVYRLVAGDVGPENYRYALLPGTDHIIKMHEWRFAFFRKTVEQLLNPPPPPPEDLVETLDPATFGDEGFDDGHGH